MQGQQRVTKQAVNVPLLPLIPLNRLSGRRLKAFSKTQTLWHTHISAAAGASGHHCCTPGNIGDLLIVCSSNCHVDTTRPYGCLAAASCNVVLIMNCPAVWFEHTFVTVSGFHACLQRHHHSHHGTATSHEHHVGCWQYNLNPVDFFCHRNFSASSVLYDGRLCCVLYIPSAADSAALWSIGVRCSVLDMSTHRLRCLLLQWKLLRHL